MKEGSSGIIERHHFIFKELRDKSLKINGLLFNLFRLIEPGDRRNVGVMKDALLSLLVLRLLAASAEVQVLPR